jgi:hypothetical protein
MPTDEGSKDDAPEARRIIIDSERKKIEREIKGKSEAEKKLIEAKSLLEITEESQEELISVTAVFPFQLFPDTITVDRQKVSIIRRRFFWVADTAVTKIGDIINVEASTGPFLGSVKIFSRYLSDSHYSMSYLKRGDAQRLQRVLQGLLIAHEKGIDSSLIPKNELITMLLELGHPIE